MPKVKIRKHQMPGDIPKQEKILLVEGKHPDKKRAKLYRKELEKRERAILKEQTKQEISDTQE